MELIRKLLDRAEFLSRKWYGDSTGTISPENAKQMEYDLMALTIAYLSNYIPNVMPAVKDGTKTLIAWILDNYIETL